MVQVVTSRRPCPVGFMADKVSIRHVFHPSRNSLTLHKNYLIPKNTFQSGITTSCIKELIWLHVSTKHKIRKIAS
jgi:hypothetical protein